MAKITYIEANGQQHHVELSDGSSIMEGALANNVPGIDADCGGQCACGTCHVYIEEPWTDKLPRPASQETEMLGFAAATRETSRLSCQLTVDQSLDGIVVHLPDGQH